MKNTVPLDQPTVSNLDFKVKRWLEERKNCVKSKYLLGVKIKVCFLIDKCCTLSKRFFHGSTWRIGSSGGPNIELMYL